MLTKLKLPKVEVKYNGSRRQYFIDGVKIKPLYNRGVRPKILLKELGLVIKFNHHDYWHDDKRYYSKFSKADRKFFPKLYKTTSEYSIHEYVDFIPLGKVADALKRFNMDLYLNLAHKYEMALDDIDSRQAGLRKSDFSLVIFDYGLI